MLSKSGNVRKVMGRVIVRFGWLWNVNEVSGRGIRGLIQKVWSSYCQKVRMSDWIRMGGEKTGVRRSAIGRW
jgi:hypothetical protein